jgi:hypothetical protein
MVGKLGFGAQRGLNRQDDIAGNICDPRHCVGNKVSRAAHRVCWVLLFAPASAGLEIDPIFAEIELQDEGSSDDAGNQEAKRRV